jgi:hypothetical protein
MKCNHHNIIIVNEIPTDDKIQQVASHYVVCEDCNEILPIFRITIKTINVPLIKETRQDNG